MFWSIVVLSVAAAVAQSSLLGIDVHTPTRLTPGNTTIEVGMSASAKSGQQFKVEPLPPCCDDIDCSPGSPAHGEYDSEHVRVNAIRAYLFAASLMRLTAVPDCDRQVDCSSLVCPPEPQKRSLHANGLSTIEEGDDCVTRAQPGHQCTCACRCVCVYPSGRVLWL